MAEENIQAAKAANGVFPVGRKGKRIRKRHDMPLHDPLRSARATLHVAGYYRGVTSGFKGGYFAASAGYQSYIRPDCLFRYTDGGYRIVWQAARPAPGCRTVRWHDARMKDRRYRIRVHHVQFAPKFLPTDKRSLRIVRHPAINPVPHRCTSLSSPVFVRDRRSATVRDSVFSRSSQQGHRLFSVRDLRIGRATPVRFRRIVR